MPGLVITARDDTFVPVGMYENGTIGRNRRLKLVVTEHGGHLGFLARGRERFWLDETILEWVAGL